MRDLLVTVPHHSGAVPLEILAEMLGDAVHDEAACAARRERLFREGDPHTDRLFLLPGARMVTATVSRFVVDLNRHPDDRGPNGVVKLRDFGGESLYAAGAPPGDDDVDARLRRFYEPFHAQVEHELRARRPLALIDGHSMTPTGPDLGPDHGAVRPAASLITGGGPDGEPVDGPVSLPGDVARALAEALDRALSDRLPLGVDGAPSGVRINDPFAVGEIQRRYAAADGPLQVPAVGVEINRALFEDDAARPLPGRIATVREAIGAALEEVRAALARVHADPAG
jgi:N-formylglutamate amidohydrolase